MQVLRRWDPKDPDDVGDFWLNWAYFLPDTVSLTAVETDVPAGLTVLEEDFTDKKVRLRLAGGTHGVIYNIQYDVDTDSGEHFTVIVPLSVSTRKKN